MTKACQEDRPGALRRGPPANTHAALRGYLVLLCDVGEMAPALSGAGDAVNASDRTQFEEFMASRWPGLVRLAFGLTGSGSTSPGSFSPSPDVGSVRSPPTPSPVSANACRSTSASRERTPFLGSGRTGARRTLT